MFSYFFFKSFCKIEEVFCFRLRIYSCYVIRTLEFLFETCSTPCVVVVVTYCRIRAACQRPLLY